MFDTRSEYDELFGPFMWLGVAVLVIFTVVILFAAVRWRSRSQELPEARDDAPLGESVYALALTAIVVILVYLTFSSMSELKADDPEDGSAAASAPVPSPPPLRVNVTASRWNWRFEYPDRGISEAGGPGRLPELVVPVGNVRFDLTSLDVIHAFYISELRFKRDAFPGHVNSFTLAFARPRVEQVGGQCAEFCGLRHSYMDFNVRVLPPAEFERWARTRAQPAGGPA